MNKKKLMVASFVLVLVLTACRFSFNLPGMINGTDTAPTPVEECVTGCDPADTDSGSLSPAGAY